MIEQFKKYIISHQLFSQKDKILLTVSGGIDSIVMCHLFKTANFNFDIAHCNFKLRGKEADKDELFVKQLANSLKVDFYHHTFDTNDYAKEKKISIQMAARELRYDWFEKTRKEHHYTFIATAHHLDDAIETVFINITKGTGIAGLHGILPKSGKIIRPLLFTDKAAIINYAKQNKIDFRQDASNNENKYTRNKIRNEIIPLFEGINPHFKQTFKKNIERFRDTEKIYLDTIGRTINKLQEKKKNEIRIPIYKLLKQVSPKTILFEILKIYNFTSEQIQQIFDALLEQSGKQFLSNTHRLIKDRRHLIISKLNDSDISTYLIEPETKKISTDNFNFDIRVLTKEKITISKSKTNAYLDFKKLQFPLVLRIWKKGDYFYPFGLYKKSGKPGKQKISDFLINAKIPLTEKENTWVLESNKKVVWLVGHRIDERFKITDSTKEIYTISLNNT